MYFTSRIMDSSSALSRWKSQNAVTVSQPNTVNGYILATKIRRIVTREYTEANHEIFGKTTKLGMKAEYSDAVNRLISKIDSLNAAVLKGLYESYEREGIKSLVQLLIAPKQNLISKFGSW